MADISTWSGTAASNNSAAPDGFPENMAPSGVNDAARETMAAVRRWYEDAEWIDYGHAPTFASATSFTVPTDLTAIYHTGRRIKIDDSSTLYGRITSSSFSSVTTVNVALDSGSISASISAVSPSILSRTNPSLFPGINDEATKTVLTLENEIARFGDATTGEQYTLGLDVNDGSLFLSGSNVNTDGGAIKLDGSNNVGSGYSTQILNNNVRIIGIFDGAAVADVIAITDTSAMNINAPVVTMFGDLAVSGGGSFTSTGIDDNATAERFQLADTLALLGDGSASDSYTLGHAAAGNDAILYISGGSNASSGANIELRGGSQGQPNQMTLRQGATNRLLIDDTTSNGNFVFFESDGSTRIATFNGSEGRVFFGASDTGRTAENGSVTIYTGASGLTAGNVNSSADDLVIENNGNAGISIVTPATGIGNIMFGDPNDNDVGRIQYDHNTDNLSFSVDGIERQKQGRLVSIADDGFGTVAVPNDVAFVYIFASAINPADWGFYWVDAGSSASIQTLNNGADFETTTGALTGTTGTDGKVTISPHTDGNLYVENRSGATLTFHYGFLG